MGYRMKMQDRVNLELRRAQTVARYMAEGNDVELMWVGCDLLNQYGCAMSFRDLLAAADHGYRPTILAQPRPRHAEMAIVGKTLADIYDYFQAKAGRNVVAYRGN